MRRSEPRPHVEVAIGVLYDEAGRVLINQRPEGKAFPRKWEFPGGKIKVGETAAQALKREFQEELGVTVDRQRPLISFTYCYDTLALRLHVNEVLAYRGYPAGRERQNIRWADIRHLRRVDLLEANSTIVRAIELPRVCLITDTQRFGARHTLELLERHVVRQRVLVIVREKTVDQSLLRAFLHDVERICHGAGSLVSIHADCLIEDRSDIDGVHLPYRLSDRCSGLLTDRLKGISCHSDRELRSAHSQGADYALLSPVKQTASHPGGCPLGWKRFADLCQHALIPVYALGGMSYSDFDLAITHGAQGIAMLGSAWRTT